MKKFFILSILIHGMLGTVLFSLYELTLKSETAQPIWITLVESKNEPLPVEAIPPPPTPLKPETVLPLPAPVAPSVFQEPLSELAMQTNPEMEESLPLAVVEDPNAGGEIDLEKNIYGKYHDFNLQEMELKVFLEEIRSQIEHAKRYPWLARLKGIEGRIQVRFRILPSGQPTEIEIVQSSQSRVLDQEAIAMVKRAARFPQPPIASNRGVVVRLPLVFHLDRTN